MARIKHSNNVLKKSFLTAQIGRTAVLEIDVIREICHFYEFFAGMRYMKSTRKSYPTLECVQSSSLCSLKDRYAFITGGKSRKGNIGCRTVQRYDLWDDKWVKMPDMLEKRHSHSSCAMNDTLYVFFGSS